MHQALRQVPFEISHETTQAGDDGRGHVITGTARDRDGTTLGFAVAVEGAAMPKSIIARLGITDSSTWDTGWAEAYGIDPGVTGEDLVREVDHPPKPSSERAQALARRRGKMELQIEDAYCRYVECKFFPD